MLLYCANCGCYAGTLSRNLHDVCCVALGRRRSVRGEANLRLFEKGLHPKSRDKLEQAWPVPRDERRKELAEQEKADVEFILSLAGEAGATEGRRGSLGPEGPPQAQRERRPVVEEVVAPRDGGDQREGPRRGPLRRLRGKQPAPE